MTRKKDGRSFIAVHDEMMDHPKIAALSDTAKVHLLRLLGYCNRFRTDGVVSATKAREKGPTVFKQLTSGPQPMLELLSDGTYYCHDYLKHQWSKEEIERQAEANRKNGLKGGRPRKANPDSNPTGLPNETQPEPEANPDQSETEAKQNPLLPSTYYPVNSPTAGEGFKDGETAAADVTYITRRLANANQI